MAEAGVVISKRVLVGGGIAVGVLVVGAAVMLGVILGGRGGVPASEPGSTSSSVPTSESVTSDAPVEQVAPPSEAPAEAPAAPTAFRLGEAVTTGNVTLTVHSVEVLSTVPTTMGSPLKAEAGGQLVLFKTTYTNSKTQADLSCGNTDLYIQVFDTEEREMAPVFETDRVAGNPECNDHLLQGKAHEWNFVFQSVAGAQPMAMSLTETDHGLDPVWIDLR